MCPQLCSELTEQLAAEAELARWTSSREEIARALKTVERRLLKPTVAKKLLGLGQQAKTAIAEEIGSVQGTLRFAERRFARRKTLHSLSDGERNQISQAIPVALEMLPKKVKTLTSCSRSEEELRVVHGKLELVPDLAVRALREKTVKVFRQHATCVAGDGAEPVMCQG